MNGLPYYKRYPRDFIDGTAGMPFELKAAYSILLDLIYMQGGKLPDDPRYISGLLGCGVRAWKCYREGLIAAGKIRAEQGIISNFRADKELVISGSVLIKQRENGRKPRKNSDLDEAKAKPKPSHTDTDTDTEGVSLIRDTVRLAFDAFNEAAVRAGWPKVQRHTKPRAAAVTARMAEAGGLDGWRAALAKAEASDFLCGRSGQFVASFDFLAKPANFTKLMEGNYDNRTRPDTNPDPTAHRIDVASRMRRPPGAVDF